MGIPTIMGAVDLPLTRIDGRELILDGYSGPHLCANRVKTCCMPIAILFVGEKEQATELEAIKDLPAETTDGFIMPLWVNTGLIADVARSLERGDEGIGLYRTEVPFMIRDFFPSEQETAANL